MKQRELIATSKFLSLVLRHQPEAIQLELEANGWILVEDLLDAAARHGRPISRELLEEVVATSDKQRFAFSDDGLCIRANQGHSVQVPITYDQAVPPSKLFHGTATRNLESIRKSGLVRGARQYVHLSTDLETARRVGERHGAPAVLVVDAEQMSANGIKFFLSRNHVWLVEKVAPEYLRFTA
jgi:putative RNA 2'-phosphotransferase